MTTRRAAILGGAALLALPGPVLAHRVARTETELRIADDGSVSVIHAIHAQDAQDAMFAAGLIERPDIGTLENRARLALHVAERFDISINEAPIALELLGAELEGKTVFVYQEGADAFPGELRVHAAMLRDLVPAIRNSVNVVMGGRTATVDFTGDDGAKCIGPEGPSCSRR